MNFLHLLSSEATQTITIHCQKSSFTGRDPPIVFKGWNGQRFEDNESLDINVVQDECKIQDGLWHKIKFIFHSQETNKFPVVALTFSSLEGEQHYMESGPVCFL
uniref:Fibrillar collagen NC1 domain-containing protein n=1 Tax=Leptobrachium leishanense TaxID=445787 RepID=A0A8C5PSW8_9ANUR